MLAPIIEHLQMWSSHFGVHCAPDFLPFETLNGVCSSIYFIGRRFKRYNTCRAASPQNFTGTFILLIRDLTISIMVLFLRSTTLFYCGLYGAL
uniref:Uncharacterized protein n=1 Tax=Kalanchoe fedtschenkoi TaxID=63787 RepID=A0A7N0UEY9_KALFE